MLARPIWKPLVRRAVTGRWQRLAMHPAEVPWPTALKRPGLYLHVPFCKNLCPFCPYNRFLYDDVAYARYEQAVHQEIDLYAPHLAGVQATSLYIGGGTPTVNVDGLCRMLAHLQRTCAVHDVCIELHPSAMDNACLDALRRAGVTMVSIGVESTSDRLLKAIGRSHDGSTALDALRRAIGMGFDAVNVDLMFALPTQTLDEWQLDVTRVLELGAHQLSTYPLFAFPYSDLGVQKRMRRVERPPTPFVRMLLERTGLIARSFGLERCAVWSWLRPAGKKFSSVTRHHYVGFGPSAASMIGSHFYVNTFHVEAYASRLPEHRPIALAMPLDRRLEMTYWLYWRVYELLADERDFRDMFGQRESLADVFGTVLEPFRRLGLLQRTEHGYAVSEAGAFWIHRLQNEYSLTYIDRLWGGCRRAPWPDEVVL